MQLASPSAIAAVHLRVEALKGLSSPEFFQGPSRVNVPPQQVLHHHFYGLLYCISTYAVSQSKALAGQP